MGGRFFGNYVPLRAKQLQTFKADVDTINQCRDTSDYHRLLVDHAMKTTELQQLRTLLSGNVPNHYLRGAMERRVAEMRREMAAVRQAVREARAFVLGRRPQAGANGVAYGVRDPVTGLTLL